ncbi:redoxin family protein [Phaeocystidibacter luteus]|uniref:Redoxin domain-containing protein n=1 Tax=Phaeocystidibacter luteus TaxID=911197 RepID=A0A6N6RHU8_9FLAO|nr:redoxin family protein [Phaeocystidibacter luteus]KAB2813915.1 redoxin domain-containing protein [Phaeocystidibacter luteus]
MKSITYLLTVIGIGVGLTAFDFSTPLEIGDVAPMADRMMENVDGTSSSLESLKEENGLLVIFSCNTCPYVIAWEEEYPKLAELADDKNIGMVLVNSNKAKREGDDSMERMKAHYEEAGYTCPYVVDVNAELANAFGAQTTPHVYLFDSDMSLVFEGSINDKFENREKEATQEWLREAMNKLAAGAADEIDPADTRQIGCSIKR